MSGAHQSHPGLGRMSLALLAWCVAAGAGGWAQEATAPQVWPPPPAVARVVMQACLTQPADLGAKPSLADRFLNLLTGTSRGREQFVRPFGIAVDEIGNLCLTDTGANVVWYFDRAQGRAARWDQIDHVRFVQPVAVAKAGGIIYVADAGLRQVVAFDEAGRLRFRLTDQFDRPVGLAMAGGQLYVVDSAAHGVFVFDPNGRKLGKFGQRGAGPGEFNFPTHVAVDGLGRVYVTDAMNARVQVFAADGRFLHGIGSLGDGSGHFSRPKGVAVDRLGQVYVADALFDNIQIFDPEGNFLLDLGSSGSAIGEFWLPSGIAVSHDDRIFIADTSNGRVQVLRYLGEP